MATKLNILAFAYALSLLVALIAVRVEWLNFEAGGMLPNREYRDGDQAEEPVTWRVGFPLTEQAWRQRCGPRNAAGNPLSRPLTIDEQAQMVHDISQARANTTLLGFVETAGLVQYPLVLLLFIAATAAFLKCGPRHALAPAIVAGIAAGLMIYRAYFTSLGW